MCIRDRKYIQPKPNVPRLSMWVSIGFVLVSLVLVPVYDGADSIINLVQKLNGLTSMPVLSVFIVGLLFRNVDPRAAIAGLVFGVALYAVFSFAWTPLHYIHMMFITLWTTVAFSLSLNRWVFGKRAEFIFPRKPLAA